MQKRIWLHHSRVSRWYNLTATQVFIVDGGRVGMKLGTPPSRPTELSTIYGGSQDCSADLEYRTMEQEQEVEIG